MLTPQNQEGNAGTILSSAAIETQPGLGFGYACCALPLGTVECESVEGLSDPTSRRMVSRLGTTAKEYEILIAGTLKASLAW